MLLFIVCLLVFHVLACLPDIDYLPPPIIHTECLKKETRCPSWYRCTSDNCRKARKLYGTLSEEKIRKIEIPEHIVTSLELANGLFEYCCRKSPIPDQCMSVCDYDKYDSQLVSSLMVGQTDCPPSALSTIHTCASRGEDHRECCERAGIPGLCIRYCNPSATPMNTTARFPCLLYLDKMKECFFKKPTNELEKFEPPIQVDDDYTNL